MAPEEVPVAEQLFRGGIPAVRAAVDAQNEEAKKAGQPTISAEPLLALAESLLPRVRAAEWRDRADAVLGAGEDAPLRDLRAVVAAADAAARDDDTRKVATMLREALDQRRAAARQKWLDDITSALDEQRVLRALRISGRGPEPGSRLPIDLARRLSDDAGAALSRDAGPERWSAVLDAVAQSPVRTSGQPAGLPADPGDELLSTARAAAARVPGVGRLLGIEPARPPRPGAIPPPPSPEAAGG
jgi:hypothetical protein